MHCKEYLGFAFWLFFKSSLLPYKFTQVNIYLKESYTLHSLYGCFIFSNLSLSYPLQYSCNVSFSFEHRGGIELTCCHSYLCNYYILVISVSLMLPYTQWLLLYVVIRQYKLKAIVMGLWQNQILKDLIMPEIWMCAEKMKHWSL